jgi:hypothetical protein
MGITGNQSSEVEYPACEASPDCLNDATMVLTLDAAVWGAAAGRWDVCPEHGRAAVAAQSTFGGVTLAPGATPAPRPAPASVPMQPSGASRPAPVPAATRTAAGYAPDAVDRAVALAKRHKLIAAVAAVTLVIGAGGAASAMSGGTSRPGTSAAAGASTSQPSTSPTAPTVSVADYVSAADCAKANTLLTNRQKEYATTATNAATTNAYTAAAKVNKYNLSSGEDRVDTLGYDLDAVFADAVGRAKAVGTVDEDTATDDAVAKCGVSTLNTNAQKAAAKADSTVDRVVALALDVPWYPKGYFQTQDPDVAVKGVSDPNCDYLRCWQLHVIVNRPCSSLYIELSTENASGDKIGFTNDILTGLSSGDRGLMTFNTADDARHIGGVTKVSCY